MSAGTVTQPSQASDPPSASRIEAKALDRRARAVVHDQHAHAAVGAGPAVEAVERRARIRRRAARVAPRQAACRHSAPETRARARSADRSSQGCFRPCWSCRASARRAGASHRACRGPPAHAGRRSEHTRSARDAGRRRCVGRHGRGRLGLEPATASAGGTAAAMPRINFVRMRVLLRIMVGDGSPAARHRDLRPLGRVRLRPARPGRAAGAGVSADDRHRGAGSGYAQSPLWPILLVAIAAAVAADLLWFAGGRRFGAALLRLMCRISLSPGLLHRSHAPTLRSLGCAIADPRQVHPRLRRRGDDARG